MVCYYCRYIGLLLRPVLTFSFHIYSVRKICFVTILLTVTVFLVLFMISVLHYFMLLSFSEFV